MAGLEAQLRITAKDESAGALAALKKAIESLDKQIMTFDKLMSSIGRVAKANDPLVASVAEAQRAFAAERSAIGGLASELEGLTGPARAAAEAQARLRSATAATTAVMVAQGAEAMRVARTIERSHQQAARAGSGSGSGFGGGGSRRLINENLPFAGPSILRGTGAAVTAGATLEEQVARLKAAGASDSEIAKARSDFLSFSRTHSGVTEADYLGGFKDARVISPGESHEMASLGALYRAALRNSGISSSEEDVGNVMRIMDELGLPNMASREGFLNNFLKTQQVFGGQISTETALAAYRNAKQSIYGWSPEFREKYFPTLLQSAGQQGGTEMATALQNYIGQHMQQSELRALADAGFVKNTDLLFNKVGDVRGLKKGAQLFESDMFRANIAQWAWDFHDQYMGRKGATEGGFDDLVAKMPRNMGSLIAFLVHNQGRIRRDAGQIPGAAGLAAGGDAALAANPVAGLDALQKSISQFAATVTGPSMSAVGAGLQSMAHGIQALAASYEDFASKHPEAAKAAGGAAIAGGAAAGGYLSFKLMTGIGRLLGFGGGAAEGGAAAGAGAGLSGILSALAPMAGILMPAAGAAAPFALVAMANPNRKDPISHTDLAPGALDAAYQQERERRRDPEAARGFAMLQRDATAVNVSGEAQVRVQVQVEAGSDLLRIVDGLKQAIVNIALRGGLNAGGRMGIDSAPNRALPIGGGIGHQ
jgi:hypothetical protein